MKKFLGILLLLFSFAFTLGCGDNDIFGEVLTSPENLTTKGYIVSWNGVENAKAYSLNVHGNFFDAKTGETELEKTFITENNTYDFSSLFSPDEVYDIYLKAVGDGEKYIDSAEVHASCETESLTEGLEYILNSDGQSYTVKNGTAKIEARIVFPDTYNNKPVTKVSGFFGIDDMYIALVKSCKVTSIRLPLGLVDLDFGTFMGTEIEEVQLPSQLKTIGAHAFLCSRKLSNVVFNDNLETIGIESFAFTAIKHIDLPNSVKHILRYAFSDTPLENFVLPKSIEILSSGAFNNTIWYNNKPNGPVYINDIFLRYKGDLDGTVVIVRDGTTKLSTSAFAGVKGLNRVVLPSGITDIPTECFRNSDVQEVIMPDTVTYIGKYAFYSCKSLKKVKLSANLKEIDAQGFSYCEGLKSIDLPNGLEYLRVGAFSCSGLESITIPETIKLIGKNAFWMCRSLTSITIPDKEIVIKEGAFSDTGIKSFVWKAKYGDIPVSCFSECSQLVNLFIESGVQVLGIGSLSSNNLSELILPQGLKKFGLDIFFNSKKLTKVIIPHSVEEIVFRKLIGSADHIDLYYEGSENDFSKIVGHDLIDTKVITVHYYTETKPDAEGNYWHYTDGKPTVW